MEAKASFLDNNLMSEPVTIPKNSTGSVTITIPSKEDTYGRNIVRLHATAISTTNDSLTGSDTTLFQAVFEDEKVSYIPIALFLIVVGIVGGFVYRLTGTLGSHAEGSILGAMIVWGYLFHGLGMRGNWRLV